MENKCDRIINESRCRSINTFVAIRRASDKQKKIHDLDKCRNWCLVIGKSIKVEKPKRIMNDGHANCIVQSHCSS